MHCDEPNDYLKSNNIIMKNLFIIYISFLTCLLLTENASAHIAISKIANTSDASPILEIKSEDSGILIPRMTSAQRNEIENPAEGLMIFLLDRYSLSNFDGHSWIGLPRFPIFSLKNIRVTRPLMI